MERLNKIESGYTPEQQEKYSSKITLNFFRHDDKSKENDFPLTDKGIEHAASLAKDLKNPTLSKASGSPKIRAQQTAYLKMIGEKGIKIVKNAGSDLKNIHKISGKNQEEINLTRGILGSPKIVEDERLDFHLSKDGTGKEAFSSYKRGEYLKWLINESDKAVRKYKDLEENSTYSKSAKNIASIIKDYIDNGSDRWNNIIKAEKTRKFPKNYNKDLERFFGSHQAVTESFLAKIIEKVDGKDKRDEFVKALNNKGFDFSEGYKVDILNYGNNRKKLLIEFEKEYKDENGEDKIFQFKKEIPIEILDEIIKEGEELEKECEE